MGFCGPWDIFLECVAAYPHPHAEDASWGILVAGNSIRERGQD